jgi:DNA uptake protein ComE-like DNA-binding protein
MKRLVALLLFAIASAAIGQELQKFEKCSLVEAGWADGDSFPVKLPNGKEIVLRLYYVDCNEVAAATETDQRRVRDQSSYFGIDDHQVTLEFGRRATDEVKKLLATPFTVQTAFATAPGRSAKPRTYGFVMLSDGRDLGEALVDEGLARSYGVRRNTPDGLNAEAAEAKMDDLELGAAIARRGIWSKTDPQRLVALRGDRRAEERELQEAFGMNTGQSIDPNTATVDEIMLLPGVGEVLAERIVEGRPYQTVEDLRRVPGIGPKVFAELKDSLQIAP